jgi:hypothetical protein
MTDEPTYTWERVDDETIRLAGHPIEIKKGAASEEQRFHLLHEGHEKDASSVLGYLKFEGQRLAIENEEFSA